MLEVAHKVDWKGKLSMLQLRIKKILNNSQLSVREQQHLTRMYKKQAKKLKVNWEEILLELPGKNLIYIKEFCKTIKVKIHPQMKAIKTKTFDFMSHIEEEKQKIDNTRKRKRRRAAIQEQTTMMPTLSDDTVKEKEDVFE
jgi:hypothetical protein